MNRFLVQIGCIGTQINPVITNKKAGPELFVKTEFDCNNFQEKFKKIAFLITTL
jgi:hypothetical protein